MSTDQATIDRLRAELAEARAIATKLRTEVKDAALACCELRRDLAGACTERDRMRSRLALIRSYAQGQNARHEVTETSPTGDDWNKLYDHVLGLTQ